MSLLARHPSQLLGARRKRDLARGGTTAGGATRTASEDHDPFLLLLGLKPLALPEITAPPARRSLGRDESTARLDETAFRTPPPPARNIENQNPAPRRALSDPRADKPSKRGRRHRHRHRRGDDQDREPKRRRVLAALGARAHHRRGKTDGEWHVRPSSLMLLPPSSPAPPRRERAELATAVAGVGELLNSSRDGAAAGDGPRSPTKTPPRSVSKS